jgi:putative endonuclease
MSGNNFWVYITTNPAKTVLYVGMTNDLARRILEHVDNVGRHPNTFTGKYNCCNLIYYEHYYSGKEASLREKQIKGYRREKKLNLIATMNPDWRVLNGEV